MNQSERDIRERERRWRESCNYAWRRKWIWEPLTFLIWPPYCLVWVIGLLFLFVRWLENLK